MKNFIAQKIRIKFGVCSQHELEFCIALSRMQTNGMSKRKPRNDLRCHHSILRLLNYELNVVNAGIWASHEKLPPKNCHQIPKFYLNWRNFDIWTSGRNIWFKCVLRQPNTQAQPQWPSFIFEVSKQSYCQRKSANFENFSHVCQVLLLLALCS